MSTKKNKHDSFVSQEEKDALLTSLKSTMHDLWRLPWLIFAPVISYVSAHFAKIPEERRSHLKNILDEIKAGSSEWVEKLKWWFKGMLWDGEKTPAKKPAGKKKSTAKTTKKPAPKKPVSWTDKVSDATKSVANKAKETTKQASHAVQDKATKAAAAVKTPAKKPAPKTTKKPAPRTAKKLAPKTTKKPAPRTAKTPTPAKKPAPRTQTTRTTK